MSTAPTATRTRFALFALCAIAAFSVVAHGVDIAGFDGRPWFGLWDATFLESGTPYVLRIGDVRAGGATEHAGLRAGDRIDLRDQTLGTRIAVLGQLAATEPTTLRFSRDGQTGTARVTGSTTWEGAAAYKLSNFGLRMGAEIFFTLLAALIAWRRSALLEGRALAAFFACTVIGLTIGPTSFVIPGDTIGALLRGVLANAFGAAAKFLVVYLASRYGTRNRARRVLEFAAYAINVASVAGSIVAALALGGLWLDPAALTLGSLSSATIALSTLAVAAVVTAALLTTARAERTRVAWLLAPIAVALCATFVLTVVAGLAKSWYLLLGLYSAAGLLQVTAGILATYALLSRRVMDAGFLIGRTVAVATLSLIVVGAFALLEWALSTVLASANHVTGLVASAALALVLGVSMSFLHKRVDAVVDSAFFGKRHAAERALREFAHEAAFVTDPAALLDATIAQVRTHTDATAASILMGENGSYVPVRAFGNATPAAGENDAAILALKAWHRPLDPHRYDTTLAGDLAIPMIARGRLVGALLCGARRSGEAYAPDEVDALREVAHGAATALDHLETRQTADGEHALKARIDRLSDTVDALRAEIEAVTRYRSS